MKHWQKVLVSEDATLLQAIQCIDSGAIGAALVIDPSQRLVGILTDGDVRRALLKNCSVEIEVCQVMNPHFKFAKVGDAKETILALMQASSIRHLPILNHSQEIVGLETLDDLIKPQMRDNPIVLMAGGLGTRLRPLTDNCPKPLLRIESKPLLEISMERFIECGFHHFIFSIHYRGNMIRDYFEDGKAWGVHIDYIHENEPLGTAGALGLIKDKPQLPFIVMNGDIMTRTNFQHLLDFHTQQHAAITVGIREYQHTLPYGVVNVHNHALVSLEEKPSHNFYINGGIYVLEPHVLDYIEPHKTLDMPGLINILLQSNHPINSFLISEYWADIGRMEDFHRAKDDYNQYFIQ